MIIPYTSPQKGALKPYIHVRLGYKKTHKILPVPVVAIIDSGADICLCQKDIGLWLGVQFTKKKEKEGIPITGISSIPIQAIKEVITLHVCNTSYECPFYFSSELPHTAPIILGQKGFFSNFKVNFDYQNKQIEILQ